MTPRPYDESALRLLFEQVEPPATLEAKWRAKVALADPPPATVDAPETPQVPPTESSPRHRTRPWLRSLGAALAAAAVGGGIIGVVAVSRQPAPDPDPNLIIETIDPTTTTNNNTAPPSFPASQANPAPAGPPPAAGPGTGQPNPGRPGTGGGGPVPAGPPAPARGLLAEWPEAANTGVPGGNQNTVQHGDLHVTEPGAIIADRTVHGTIYVEAPDVTLRRVVADPPGDATVAVRQQASAPRLRIEDSDVGDAIVQGAPGLVVQRSTVTGRTLITSDATVVDCYVGDLQTRGGVTRITLRHNTILGNIALLEQAGPVTDVTIDRNRLSVGGNPVIMAPGGAGSRDIRVTGNEFNRLGGWPGNVSPAVGWNPEAAGNIWTGNVWSGSGDPANPE
jgi:hypothetical protein